MRTIKLGLGLLGAVLFNTAASAGTLSGVVNDSAGQPINGAMLRFTNNRNISESVFTNAEGDYTLTTMMSGTLNIRLRSPYFHDDHDKVVLAKNANIDKNMSMTAMTSAVEISDSLPAAYHFGSLPFEEGDDADFNRRQFQRDCLSCHQLGNTFTRVPRQAKDWTGTIGRMHLYMGNFDKALRDRRSSILEQGFNGKALSVRPRFPVDAELQKATIYEYPLLNRGIPQDTIAHPESGLLYSVDQALHHISVTDPKTGNTTYIAQQGSLADQYYTGTPAEQTLSEFEPGKLDGPHSLDRGLDGKYYVTNTGSTSIGVFNPANNQWQASHRLPVEHSGHYPHSIRVNKAGMVYFTMAGAEHIGRLNPELGSFDIIALPLVKSGGISAGTQPYGIDISPIDDALWYSRLFGDKIGRIDPVTLAVTEYDSPVRGPRRMRFDSNGILWVAGFSEGKLARINVSAGFESSVYAMPEFAPGYPPAPYALAVHPNTQEIWLNETMTDHLYRFIPSEEHFIAYPMPLSGSYTRDTTFLPDGRVCAANSPIPAPALEGGILEIICIDTGT